ncbi:MAG: hypothetical protein V3W19_08920 [Desulfatiglandales bacterium]
MVEYWNVEDPAFSGVDFNEEVSLLLTSSTFHVDRNCQSHDLEALDRLTILPFYSLDLEALDRQNPLFHYSSIPVVSEAN